LKPKTGFKPKLSGNSDALYVAVERRITRKCRF